MLTLGGNPGRECLMGSRRGHSSWCPLLVSVVSCALRTAWRTLPHARADREGWHGVWQWLLRSWTHCRAQPSLHGLSSHLGLVLSFLITIFISICLQCMQFTVILGRQYITKYCLFLFLIPFFPSPSHLPPLVSFFICWDFNTYFITWFISIVSYSD